MFTWKFSLFFGVFLILFVVLSYPLYTQVQMKDAFPNLTFSSPVGLYHPGDSTDRLFVVGQAGVIYVFPNNPSAITSKKFLDIHDSVAFGGELGLLGFAFHPHYNTNGYFYVYYTMTNPSGSSPYLSIISRFQSSAINPDSAIRSSEIVLMRINQPYSNHKGGQLAFGPDGYLYIGLGDGGDAGDPQGNGQNKSTLLGKILRIDVDSTMGLQNYRIPPDNPFYADTSSTVKKEIFAYGLRNPWRFSFDVVRGGTLWVADVGQNNWEEIDTIRSGGNYGWNITEGAHCYNPPSGCNTTGLIMPIWEYSHVSGGCSITGGFVYRGSANSSLYGKYIYADYCSQKIWTLDLPPAGSPSNTLLMNTGVLISSFGVDKYGELYFCSYIDGRIYKLVPDPPTVPILLLPSNGEINISTNPILLWKKVLLAETYHAQVSTDSVFTTLVVNDSTLTDTVRMVGPLAYATKYYWRVSAKNISNTSSYSGIRSFTTTSYPVQPAPPVLIVPPAGSVDMQTLILFRWHSSTGAASYHLQVATDSIFSVVLFDDSTLIDTSQLCGPLSNNSMYYWRVRSKNAVGYGVFSEVRIFHTAMYSYYFQINQSWNLISIPISVNDSLKNSIFPTSVSSAFEYSSPGGYLSQDTLLPGKGYWLKFNDSQTVAIAGVPRLIDTIDIVVGWNLIGSLSDPVPVLSIASIPPGIVISNFFRYNGSYLATDTIYSGFGYWIKADQEGKLILSSSSSIAAQNRIKIVSSAELPPPSPEEVASLHGVPKGYSLENAYPNPFNPTTTLKYALSGESRVKLVIYNVLGQVVDVLMDAVEAAGYKSVEWNANNVASGIYFYRLDATSILDPGKSFTQIKKMLLLK
jgi:glucose/arabinose dehydrogenase